MRLVGIKFLFAFFLHLSLNLFAQTPYDVTKKGYKPDMKLVHDFGKIFNGNERNALERKLVDYNDSTSVQIVVVTFESLEGYPIELLGNEIGEKWGVGQKDLHNGIVIVLSNEERLVTLRGGYGIQAKMPPTIEKLIIAQEMIPYFREGRYYEGIDKAIDAIQLQLAGQYDATPHKNENPSGEIIVFLIFIGIFLTIAFLSGEDNGGRGGPRGRRGGWPNVIITNTGSSPWSSGGFGSGGGFGGFGGGSFGGGGATGSW